VFCDVEPKDLRYVESGRYAKAFEEHQHKRRVAVECIQTGRQRLTKPPTFLLCPLNRIKGKTLLFSYKSIDFIVCEQMYCETNNPF